MGQYLMRRRPKYVQGFIDLHGKPRWYFRRACFELYSCSRSRRGCEAESADLGISSLLMCSPLF
jgi:hypothetical protein